MKEGKIINENEIVLPVSGSHVVAAGIGGKEKDMTREDIEKAALKGVEEYVNSGNLKGFRGSYCKGFMEGADWRINSVWHDINEIPKDGRIIVLLGKYGIMLIYGPNMMYYKESVIADGGFLKWAYKEDLIPNTEE